MKVYVAVVAPEHDTSRVVGVFSTLELAQAAFAEGGEWDERHYHGRREWWQKKTPYGYNDNEIHEGWLNRARPA